jgi:tRNA threonylcarbamoyladenosine biosynthesis protein TsaE
MPDSRLPLPDEAATHALATCLAAKARPGDVLLLSGPLGAGKSSFARAFIRACSGDPDLEVPSPTFTLLQNYETKSGLISHYDLWRLSGPDGLAELGWDEALAGIVLVEWPDRLGWLTPAEALRIDISLAAVGREIRLTGEQRWFDAS